MNWLGRRIAIIFIGLLPLLGCVLTEPAFARSVPLSGPVLDEARLRADAVLKSVLKRLQDAMARLQNAVADSGKNCDPALWDEVVFAQRVLHRAILHKAGLTDAGLPATNQRDKELANTIHRYQNNEITREQALAQWEESQARWEEALKDEVARIRREIDEAMSATPAKTPVPDCPRTTPGTGQTQLVPLPDQSAPARQPRSVQTGGDYKFVVGPVEANVATDNQADCEFSAATPTLTVLLPVDASGNPLPFRDGPAAPMGPVTASNPPAGGEAPPAAPAQPPKQVAGGTPGAASEPPKTPAGTPPADGGATTPSTDKPIWIGPIPPGTLPGLPEAGVTSGGDYGTESKDAKLEPAPAPAPADATPAKPDAGPQPDRTPPAPSGKAEPAKSEPAKTGPPKAELPKAETGKPVSVPEGEWERWLRDRIDFHEWLRTGQGKAKLTGLTPMERYILYLRLLQSGGMLPPGKVDPPGGPVAPESEDSILEEIDEVLRIAAGLPSKPDPDAGGVITISFKATPAAIQAGLEGKEGIGGLVMLTMSEPAMPKADTSTKAVQDKDFDKKALKCARGKDKECTVELDAATAESIGIPANGPRKYQAFVAPSHTGSGVLEKPAGAPKVTPPATPSGAQVTETGFTIGDRSFIQVDVVGSAADVALVMAAYSQTYGPLFAINICREKKLDHCGEKEPAPQPGVAPDSPGASELPQARVELATGARTRSAAR